MPAEAVVDASVLGAAFFAEEHTEAAREWLIAGRDLAAPELLLAEIASIGAKKLWRGEIDPEAGERALAETTYLIGELHPLTSLASAALGLAAEYRFSAYDAFYLALADTLRVPLITLDNKLITRCAANGLEALVQPLAI